MNNARSFIGQDATIILDDCLGALGDIPDESVDLVFADPPYNIGKPFDGTIDRWSSIEDYTEWCFSWLNLVLKKLKPDGSLYLMTSTQAMPLIDIWIRTRMTILSRIIWHYDSSGVQAKKYYGSMYEPILFAVCNPQTYKFNANSIEVEAKTGAVRKLIDYRKDVPTPYSSKKVPGNVWYFPRVRYRMPEYEEHPTQKPEVLLERIILASTNPGDLVLDPFAGTFTTCAVASRLGRRSIGIEKSETYFKIGLRRLGITSNYNGEALSSPEKSFTRRIQTSHNCVENQRRLFNE